MFGLIFAMIYIPYILLRVAFMLFRVVGMILFLLGRTAYRASQRRKANQPVKPRKGRTEPFPKLQGKEVFL